MFVEDRSQLVEVLDPEDLCCPLRDTAGERGLGSTVGQKIQDGEGLGVPDRVALRQQRDRGAEPDRRRAGRRVGKEQLGGGKDVVAEVVLANAEDTENPACSARSAWSLMLWSRWPWVAGAPPSGGAR